MPYRKCEAGTKARLHRLWGKRYLDKLTIHG